MIAFLILGLGVTSSLGENIGKTNFQLSKRSIAYFSLNEGELAYWSFDEGSGSIAHDGSGYGNNGTIYGASWTTGVSETAMDFDGTDDYIEIVNPNELNFGTDTDFTFTAWIKARESQLPYPTIVGRRNPPASRGYIFFNYGIGQLTVQLNRGEGVNWDYKNYFSGSQNLYNNLWHHVAATGDRDDFLRFYVNGILQTNQYDISGFGNIDSSSNLFIGWEEKNPSATYFNGIIDEVRIYNKALTESEVQALYESWNQPPSVQIINPKAGFFHFSGIPLVPTIFNLFDKGRVAEVKTYLSYSCKYLLMFLIPSAFGLSILAETLLGSLTTAEFIPKGRFIIPLIAGVFFSSTVLFSLVSPKPFKVWEIFLLLPIPLLTRVTLIVSVMSNSLINTWI